MSALPLLSLSFMASPALRKGAADGAVWEGEMGDAPPAGFQPKLSAEPIAPEAGERRDCAKVWPGRYVGVYGMAPA